jgi:5-methylcytosine-specific restriction endonuclease McrA
MPRKEVKSLPSWLLPRLRRISLWWPSKSIARDRSKVVLEVGQTKKGKPIKRVFYKCASCEGLFTKEETQMDHIESVIKLEGFTNWDEVINRLFCNPEGYQTLCRDCHAKKTGDENIIRKALSKQRKTSKKR